jgi:hypothetical protein
MRRQLSLIALSIALSACFVAAPRADSPVIATSGGASKPADAPDWFLAPPQTDKDLSAAATAGGPDPRFALDKAVLDAKYNLGDRLRDHMSGTMRKMIEEAGGAKNPRLVQESNRLIGNLFTDVGDAGYLVARQKTYSRREGHRVYVLVEYCVAEAEKAFVQAIKKNETVMTGVRASATFKELESHHP